VVPAHRSAGIRTLLPPFAKIAAEKGIPTPGRRVAYEAAQSAKVGDAKRKQAAVCGPDLHLLGGAAGNRTRFSTRQYAF
jgi:hypothetical protein